MAASKALDEYLERHVRLWLGLGQDLGTPVPEVPSPLVRRLLRVEEYEIEHRDQWGGFTFASADSFRTGKLWVPELDRWLDDQRRQLASARVPLTAAWPNGHPFVLCPTHDVDMVSRQMTGRQALRSVRAAVRPVSPRTRPGLIERVARVARAIGRAAYYGTARAPSTRDSLERCLEIERTLGVTSTYLFTVYPRTPTPYDCVYSGGDPCFFSGRRTTVAEVARAVAEEGHDVGLHGSYRSAVDGAVLAQEKTELSAMIGRDVTSTRQHYLHFDIRQTPRAQRCAGLTVDSTMGFNRTIGFRAGTSLPFRHFDYEREEAVDVLQVPLIVQESPLLSTDGLELSPALAEETVAAMIDTVAQVGGVATVLFHPHSLINDAYLRLYRFALEYGRDRGAWIASLSDIDRWWREREIRLVG